METCVLQAFSDFINKVFNPLTPQGDGNKLAVTVSGDLVEFSTHSPRKGMETNNSQPAEPQHNGFSTHSPRKGMETFSSSESDRDTWRFSTHSPRKGMETKGQHSGNAIFHKVFNPLTPQGDGNSFQLSLGAQRPCFQPTHPARG